MFTCGVNTAVLGVEDVPRVAVLGEEGVAFGEPNAVGFKIGRAITRGQFVGLARGAALLDQRNAKVIPAVARVERGPPGFEGLAPKGWQKWERRRRYF